MTVMLTRLAPTLHEALEAAQLPALPLSAIEILRVSQDPKACLADFTKPIEADVGLMGQVLRFVNSAYFGFAREISNIQQAVSLVGMRPIQNFVLWGAVFSLIPSPKCGSFDLKKLWQDSLRRGILSRELGKALKLANSEELFVAALLQDIAIPILCRSIPEVYEPLITARAERGVRLSEIETEQLGWNHAQAAAMLCRKWGLPETFADLVEQHSAPNKLLCESPPRYDAACVAVAAMLPSCVDTDWPEQHQFFRALQKLTSGVQINFAAVFNHVDDVAEDFAPLLKLPPPAKKLSAWLREGAKK